MAAVQLCSRCGLQGHRAVECSKPFLAEFCSYCKRRGHTVETCRAACKVALEDRESRLAREDAHYANLQKQQQRRTEEKAAYEERQQRRAEAARRHAAWLADHPCWRCGQCGHTRDSCPLGSTPAAKDKDACSDISSVRSLASSMPSTATTAATAAALPQRVSDLPDTCKFCGTKRLEHTKRKAHSNLCRDRCHSCWRAF